MVGLKGEENMPIFEIILVGAGLLFFILSIILAISERKDKEHKLNPKYTNAVDTLQVMQDCLIYDIIDIYKEQKDLEKLYSIKRICFSAQRKHNYISSEFKFKINSAIDEVEKNLKEEILSRNLCKGNSSYKEYNKDCVILFRLSGYKGFDLDEFYFTDFYDRNYSIKDIFEDLNVLNRKVFGEFI